MPKIDQQAHFELRMWSAHAAELYEQTGNLEYALMQTGEDWTRHPGMMAVYNRATAREVNGGTLPKATPLP